MVSCGYHIIRLLGENEQPYPLRGWFLGQSYMF